MLANLSFVMLAKASIFSHCYFEVVQRGAAVDFALLLQSFDKDSRTHMEES